MPYIKKVLFLVAAAIVMAAVVACDGGQPLVINTEPVGFHSGDECHVCGMLIAEWPGPKGESINTRNGSTHKFCSTADMFSWLLQPENSKASLKIYVHDMAKAHWRSPEDEYLIDATQAWYVLGSDLAGAMEPALASYGDLATAQAVAEKFDGQVLRFEDITLETLRETSHLEYEQALKRNEDIQQLHHGSR